MMPTKFTHTLLAGLLALPALEASATDLVLSVPLKLEGLPRGVARAKVACQVYANDTQSLGLGNGTAVEPIDFRSGSLLTNATVRVSLRPEHRGILPTHYACRLYLLAPWATPPWQSPGPEAPDPALRPAPDTEFNAMVTGEIPQGVWSRPQVPRGPLPGPR
jgi:hypothetical protein